MRKELQMTDKTRGYPTIAEAEALLKEGERRNPGKWGDHCRVAGMCARKIAEAAGLDGEKAQVLGMLHDIGRRYGIFGIRHAVDGYSFLMEKGYPVAARICLTHSFTIKSMADTLGKNDLTPDEEKFLMDYIASCEYDDYDLLMQLCDAIAMAEGPADMTERMGDVKKRYGWYPQEKWDKNIALGEYFSEKAGRPIMEIVTCP